MVDSRLDYQELVKPCRHLKSKLNFSNFVRIMIALFLDLAAIISNE